MEDRSTDAYRFSRELLGLFLLFWALLLLLSLFTFDANDPSLNHVVSGNVDVRNKAGLFGAYAAGFLNDVFGVAAFLWPLAFGALGAAYVSPAYAMHWWRWCGFFLLTLCLLVISAFWDFTLGDLRGGGMVGEALHNNSSRYLSPGGSGIAWFFVLLVGLQLACNISWFGLLARAGQKFMTWRNVKGCPAEPPSAEAFTVSSEETSERPMQEEAGGNTWGGLKAHCRAWLERCFPKTDGKPVEEVFPPSVTDKIPAKAVAPEADDVAEDVFDDEPFAPSEKLDLPDVLPAAPAPESVPSSPEPRGVPNEPPQEQKLAPPSKPVIETPPPVRKQKQEETLPAKGRKAAIPLPSLELLTPPAKLDPLARGNRRENLEDRARALMACLKDFDIQGELVRVTPGPVVTMFEVRPAPGIRVNRIANLNDDLALALKAIAVRIQAPIPGSDTVGIEIPNDNRET
ncbi:MAG: DNA translocase FtsK 4TM domain-containing protein, partial [Desulfovibrionaceae bacterium]|nr:DNA translocase FtsK 4TM domain-containing protein [Desulfovibrionaceae bacterium]